MTVNITKIKSSQSAGFIAILILLIISCNTPPELPKAPCGDVKEAFERGHANGWNEGYELGCEDGYKNGNRAFAQTGLKITLVGGLIIILGVATILLLFFDVLRPAYYRLKVREMKNSLLRTAHMVGATKNEIAQIKTIQRIKALNSKTLEYLSKRIRDEAEKNGPVALLSKYKILTQQLMHIENEMFDTLDMADVVNSLSDNAGISIKQRYELFKTLLKNT